MTRTARRLTVEKFAAKSWLVDGANNRNVAVVEEKYGRFECLRCNAGACQHVSAVEDEKAYKLGVAAFKNGAKRIPALDKHLLAMIERAGSRPVGASVPVLDAWLKGWDDANLFPHEFQLAEVAD